MVWEAVFFLVLLKIPLVYACLVVWWAIRAEPRDEHPVVAAVVPDTPGPSDGRWRPSGSGRPAAGRRGPREGVARRRVTSGTGTRR